MGTHGRIEEFHVGKSTWVEYKERLECFFMANDITVAEKKRAIFLSSCGAELYSVVRALVAPQTPVEVDLQTIIDRLGSHFNPKPSSIVQRFLFNKCIQKANQSVADFIAELRKLSEHCEFESELENMLRDRIVCGVRDSTLQQTLLTKSNLTFAMARDDAIAAEAAQLQLRELRNDIEVSGEIKKLSPKTGRKANSTQRSETKNRQIVCIRCGGMHLPSTCPHIKTECRFCSKIGHLERMCLQKKSDKNINNYKQQNNTNNLTDNSVENEDVYSMHNVNSVQKYDCIKTVITVNDIDHEFEVDSGSVCTIVSETQFNKHWPRFRSSMERSGKKLRMWTQASLRVIGTLLVNVKYGKKVSKLPLTVVEGNGTSLVGRNWFEALGLEVIGVMNVSEDTSKLKQILENYEEVFKDELGQYKGPEVRVDINHDVSPIFLKARRVPYAIKKEVGEEIEKLVKQGVLSPIPHSDWATPIVAVKKKNNTFRICGDYRSTVNVACKKETYPLPTVSEVLTTVSRGTVFTKLDMRQAYQQLKVDSNTAKLLTLNTHKGLYQVNRLPFGISSAVAIFQRTMDTLLCDVPGVKPYLDDIIVSGESIEEHNNRLQSVLERIARAGLRLQKDKCQFAVKEIEFLGFLINQHGIQPTSRKVEAIKKAPVPTNKQQLQSFLGLLNFYGCFLNNRAHILEPLHRLLDKDTKWVWKKEQNLAFEEAKAALQSDTVLAHYDEKKPLIIVCDASPYGVGAVLAHKKEDGKEAPIAFASRTLSSAERNYSQLDKEALAIRFAVVRFHEYIYGRKYQIYTDHKPLLGLLNPKKPLPQVISPRLLRWSLELASYNYELFYRPGAKLTNADALSRLPVQETFENPPAPKDVLLLEKEDGPLMDSEYIARLTSKDMELSKVRYWTLNGWPEVLPVSNFKPFYDKRLELSVHKNCILWGNRVVIPLEAREEMLKSLHMTHPGIVQMKALARSYIWWPGMDKCIEKIVHDCRTCQETRHAPPKSPIHLWEWPVNPWSRIHVDFAGPVDGKTFLIIVDAHSKWLEITQVSGPSSSNVIKILRNLFATHGLPDVIVSDNGTAFVSQEFRNFAERNGIRLATVAPYHPSSNGQAERMVQTAKNAIKRMDKRKFEVELPRFLLAQHVTPVSTTGKSPAELLMRRQLKTIISRVQPNLTEDIHQKQEEFMAVSTKIHKPFVVGEPVFARNYTPGSKWVEAEITDITGPVSYRAVDVQGQSMKRHADQLRRRSTEDTSTEVMPDEIPDFNVDTTPEVEASETLQPTEEATPNSIKTPRPSRVRHPPVWAADYKF